MIKEIIKGLVIAIIAILFTASIAQAITLWYLDGTTLKPVDSSWTVSGISVGALFESVSNMSTTTNETKGDILIATSTDGYTNLAIGNTGDLLIVTGGTLGYRATSTLDFLGTSDINTYSKLNTIVAGATLTHNGLIDSYNELNTIVTDQTLTHNGLINTYSELNTIVADQTLTHNGLINTFSEIDAIVADKSLLNTADYFSITAFNFTRSSSTDATTTNFSIAGLAGGGTQCLQIDNTGNVSATGASCGGISNSLTKGYVIIGDGDGTAAATSTMTIDPDTGNVVIKGTLDMGNNALNNAGAAGNDLGSSNTLVATTMSGAIAMGSNDITGGATFNATKYALANMFLDEKDSSTMQVRNTADNAYLDFWALGFKANGTLTVGASDTANSGDIRMRNNQYINMRNAANDGNVSSLKVNTSDRVEFGTDIEGLVVITSLEIPNAANPTVNATGEVAIDTTSDQLKYYGTAVRVIVPFSYPAFTYTTTSWNGTTTIALGTAFINETWSATQCFTNAGSLSFRFNDGTNYMDWTNASTTVGNTALTTNNTFITKETRYITVGSPLSGPNSISCTVKKSYDPD